MLILIDSLILSPQNRSKDIVEEADDTLEEAFMLLTAPFANVLNMLSATLTVAVLVR